MEYRNILIIYYISINMITNSAIISYMKYCLYHKMIQSNEWCIILEKSTNQ